MVPMLWFPILLSCSTISLSHIHSLKEPGDLNKYLCDQDHPLLPNTQLLLSSDVKHILSSKFFCLVSNTSNITLSSTSESPANITCRQQNTGSVGFGFYNVSGLSIDNIHITHCGGPMPSPNQTNSLYPNDTTFYFVEGQLVTLLISYSSNIMLFRMTVINYYGFAVLLINPNNNVNLTNVIVNSSTMVDSNSSQGGSGLVIYFSNLNNRSELMETHILLNKIVMYWNINLVPYNEVSNAAKVYTIKPKAISSFAAGLTIIFSQGNYSADVCLTIFYGDVISGGVFDGIAFIFSDAPVGRTSIVIKNSEFDHNVVSSGKQAFFGIGIMVTKVKSSNGHTLNGPWNIITISNSSIHDHHNKYFMHNEFSFSSKLNLYNHSAFHVITASNVFSNITIRISDFKYVQSFTGIRNPFIFSETTKGHKNVQFILESVTLKQSYFTAIETTLNTGKLVFVNTASVYINGINDFSEMTGSVIQAYNSDIHLNGSARFHDNNASHGAAIRLDSSSHLFIHESTNVSFVNNHASFYGGAIYSRMDRNLHFTNPPCAIQIVSQNISQSNITLFFNNNTATLAGNSIYVSPLYDCQQLYLTNVNSSDLFNKVFHFIGDNQVREISSVAVSTQLCSMNGTSVNHPIKVYPGETITIGLRANDLNGNPTYAQIFTRLTQAGKKFFKSQTEKTYIIYELPAKQKIQTVYNNGCTPLKFTILSQNTSVQLELHIEILGYVPTTSIKLLQLTCPLGFVYNSEVKACVCSVFLKRLAITQCNIDTTSVNIPPQSWLGVVDNGRFIGYTEHCPPGYCLQSTIINITQPDIMCRGNRMGWLCGQCKNGYSNVLGSNDCYQCSNTLHTALAISLGILGGIVYVLVLFSLRLTIDLGTLGGFIFWLNIIWPYAIPSYDVALKHDIIKFIVYLLTSIKYKWNIPVCITSDLNELSKIGILYFFPIYFWLIVAVIVLLSHCSTRIANFIVGSSVQVLVTLMYISYSDLLSISLLVLTPAHIYYNSTNSTGMLLVWFRDGGVLYGHNPFHIVLLCISIAVLSFFIVPFTLVGLFGVKMLRSRFISKYFRPFIDAIHGPYKDNLRYWFGLRLIIMSLVYIVIVVLQGSNMTLQLVLSLIILGSFTLAEGVFLPFKSRIINILDLWFMVLLLFNILMNLAYSSSETTTTITTTITIVLSFVTFFVILLYHSYLSMSRFRCIRKCVQCLFTNGNCKRIKKIIVKSSARSRSQNDLMPPLRDDDHLQYED